MNDEKASLATLLGGTTVSRFDEALLDAIQNLIDPNTDWKTARKVVLTLTIKAASESRDVVGAIVKIETKLAQQNPEIATMFIGRTRNGFVLTEHNERNDDLSMSAPALVKEGA